MLEQGELGRMKRRCLKCGFEFEPQSLTEDLMPCPNCGAIMNPEKVDVIDGKPYLTCDYCKNKFEMTEEPTW